MSAWFKRFGLHLAAAVGATGIFVAAAAVGASQVRQQTALIRPAVQTAVANRTPVLVRRPSVEASPSPLASGSPVPRSAGTPRTTRVVPERSLAGTVQEVLPDELDIVGPLGREWHVVPDQGALLRLNGRATTLDGFQVGDTVVILGQTQANSGPGNHFLAHAITGRRR